MCPEILNFILYENKMDHIESLVKFVAKYNKPWVVDIWSLGCVILEILSGVPLWMSLKTIVNNKGKDQIETGLFAVKGRFYFLIIESRIFDKIIERQIEVVTNIDSHFEKSMFSGIKIDKELKYLVKRMLQLDPEKRISPKEIIQILDRT
jgi:dual specificity tyrosine-phosphorylation-regulated kinase 2/3/4